MATREEQETTVTAGRAEEVVHIYTANPVHLRRLRKEPRATELKGGEDWGQFSIQTSDFDPLKGFRRASRSLTPEQRIAAGERLAKAREARAENA